MNAQELREHELARSRELIQYLDPCDPYRLGLYAVLEVLAEEAKSRGKFSTACIAEREIYANEPGGRSPDASGIALMVCGRLLGHLGEDGWRPICEQAARDKGLAGCFMKSSFRIIQRPHAELNWMSKEEEEIAAAIANRRRALDAALLAHALASDTLPAGATHTGRRGL